MTYWTETAISRHLNGRFYQLQQRALGKLEVVDLNEVPVEEPTAPPATRWTDQELVYLVELKRQGKTHAQCAVALGRTEAGVMDKWQNRTDWMKSVSAPRREPKLWLDDIARVVCGYFGVQKSDFASPRRWRKAVEARMVFYWMAREFTSFSLPQIGAFCCGRDHSTVLHGIQSVNQRIDRYRTAIEVCAFDLGLSLEEQEAA